MLALTLGDRSARVVCRVCSTFALWLGASLLPFYVLGFVIAGSGANENSLWMLPSMGLALTMLGLAVPRHRGERHSFTMVAAVLVNAVVLALAIWPH